MDRQLSVHPSGCEDRTTPPWPSLLLGSRELALPGVSGDSRHSLLTSHNYDLQGVEGRWGRCDVKPPTSMSSSESTQMGRPAGERLPSDPSSSTRHHHLTDMSWASLVLSVKNPPAKAGDTDPIPDPGRSHVVQSSEARVPQLLSLRSRAQEPPSQVL